MLKQTAVEWLVEQLTPSIALQQKYIDKLKNQALAMEKEQIVDAHRRVSVGLYTDAEKYYNETYKGGKE
jgi:hypothetical protein